MFKKLFKLNATIFLLLCGYFIYAAAIPSHTNSSYHQKHASFTPASAHVPDQQLVNNSGVPVQVFNFQRHKTVHYTQCIYTWLNTPGTYFKYLDHTCGRYSSEFSLFRKLILFPFHVFW